MPTGPASVSITLSNIYTVLRTFILQYIPGSPTVIQGYPKRTAMPVGPFIAITAMLKKRLSTNIDSWQPTTSPAPAPGPQTLEERQQVTIQMDVYGATSGEWADMLTALLRDNVGCLALAPTATPLYADDPVRAPLTNAEAQYEDRWIVQAVLQYNQVVTVGQDYAVELGPVDIMTPIV
jgi:hypothetical protein